MTIQLSGEEFEEIKLAFVAEDTDGDGRITKTELVSSMRAKKEDRSEQDVDDFLKLMDIDGDGAITFNEYLEMMARLAYGKTITELEIKQMFRAYDTDGNGFLSPEEMKRLISFFVVPVSDEEVRKIVATLDVNGDGQIDYSEVLTLMYRANEDVP